MPEYGDVIQNITSIYVAQLQSDNTYGTPSYIDLGSQFSWEYESDTDEIKAYGVIAELLSVPTKATGTLIQASLDLTSFNVMTSNSASESGSTPNRLKTIDVQVGDSGLPYFGIIAAYASTNGANMLGGFAKCMLDTVPGYTVEQNTFRVAEVNMSMIAPSQTIRKVYRGKKYETAADIPATAGDFDTYFDGFFD